MSFAGPTISITEGWTHICYTYTTGGVNTGTEIFYKNGAFSVTRTGVMPAWDTVNDWNIGKGSAGWYFNGALDEVRIYNRALSAQEITSLYNSGKIEVRK